MSNPRTVLLELSPAQVNYLADVLDAVDAVPTAKVMLYAQIRQQLAQPQDTEELVARIKQQALQEAQPAAPPADQQ